MYTPPFNQVQDETELRAMVAAVGMAWLVTTGADGVPVATALPIMWRGQTVVAHMARANPQWRHIQPGTPGLLIVAGPGAYVSPSWYAAKAEHGKVVPTWNYLAVHLTGSIKIHEGSEWVRAAVTDLTDRHEGGREHPWQVTDAPDQYVEGQLRGIVGIEVTVTSVEGKAKLSQNRSEADRHGVIEGMSHERYSGAAETAAAMRRASA